MITIDDTSWPVLTVSFTGKNSPQEFNAYLARMTEYLRRGVKHAVILDSRDLAATPTLEQRQRQVDWIQANTPALRQWSLGNAFVITSPFIRLAMNIMYQLQPLPTPHTVVGDIKMARTWVDGRFRAVGLPPPPEVPVGRRGSG
ncbi:hypothetical protein [Melittangium boletus]|uniref:hypothetical protein n=1 Tax=Melittangium boletus TaxID=83453 RepID=UPI003DA5284F